MKTLLSLCLIVFSLNLLAIEKEEFDTNKDGKIDLYKEFKKRDSVNILTLKRIDINFDGKFDYEYIYDDHGLLKLMKVDYDFDGHWDNIVYYNAGKIETEEYFLNYDDKADIIARYVSGVLSKKEIDTDLDGSFDRIEFYGKNGKLNRVINTKKSTPIKNSNKTKDNKK